MVCPTMSMKELEMWIQAGRPMVLVDLRSRQEYEAGHLQGAVNIPYEELETRLEEIPRQLPCVLYCSRGSQSLLACSRLNRLGRNAVNVYGGLAAYRGTHLLGGRGGF